MCTIGGVHDCNMNYCVGLGFQLGGQALGLRHVKCVHEGKELPITAQLNPAHAGSVQAGSGFRALS